MDARKGKSAGEIFDAEPNGYRTTEAMLELMCKVNKNYQQIAITRSYDPV